MLTKNPRARVVSKEIVSALCLGALYPFGWIKSRRITPRARKQRTVVFVHGYLANRSCFFPMAAYLKCCGVERVLFFEYHPGQSPEAAAVALRAFLKKNVRGGRIDLICHSLGGIIGRLYLQLLGGARRVDRCITIGTPHQGTYNAYWVPTGVGDALRPESQLFTRIARSDEAPCRVRFVSIEGDADNIILPRKSARHSATHHTFKGLGHLGLLTSPRVMGVVANAIA